jgi:hypothetical protein
VSGQTASKNLDSSEKFSLGGINGVRAYPQGEASGDEGYRGTVELRHNVMPNVQATVFYDWGKVTINRNPFGARGLQQPQPGRCGRGRQRQPGPGATALVPGLAHRRRFADVHPGLGGQAAYAVDAGFGRFLI